MGKYEVPEWVKIPEVSVVSSTPRGLQVKIRKRVLWIPKDLVHDDEGEEYEP